VILVQVLKVPVIRLGIGFTVTFWATPQPETIYEIVVVPAASAAMAPEVLPIVPVVVFVLLHVPPTVVLFSVVVTPTQEVKVPVIGLGKALTVTVFETLHAPVEYVTVDTPTDTTENVPTEPVLPVATTLPFEDAQVPPPVALLNVTVAPTHKPDVPVTAAGDGVNERSAKEVLPFMPLKLPPGDLFAVILPADAPVEVACTCKPAIVKLSAVAPAEIFTVICTVAAETEVVIDAISAPVATTVSVPALLNCHPVGALSVKIVAPVSKSVIALSATVIIFKVVKAGCAPPTAVALHKFKPLTGAVTTTAPNDTFIPQHNAAIRIIFLNVTDLQAEIILHKVKFFISNVFFELCHKHKQFCHLSESNTNYFLPVVKNQSDSLVLRT